MIDWFQRILQAQEEPTYEIAGSTYHRIPYGDEDVETATIAEHSNCHDCDVQVGQLHVPGCDVERCPACSQQAISCSCTSDEKDEMDCDEQEDVVEVEDRP